MPNAYETLLEQVRDQYALRSAAGLLGWDQETKMPPKGGEVRARAQAALSRVMHQRITDAAYGDALTSTESQAGALGLGARERACLAALRRDRDKAVKIPERLAAEMAETASLAQQAWAQCRAQDNAAGFLAWLEKVIALKREEIACMGTVAHPYDALLDSYEPGATVAALAPVLESLGEETAKLLPLILDKQAREKRGADATTRVDGTSVEPWGDYRFPIAAQQAFNEEVLTAMGFDLQAGRLDASAHPFTEGLSCRDVRLTTRYREDDVQNALYSTLHEGGHGLYEQGFDEANALTPLAEAVSLGIHESQSRLWENAIGRSLPFWRWLTPRLRAYFPGMVEASGEDLPHALWRRANRVGSSFIRVEADEVSYNLHIVLRFRLEKALFEGAISVRDLEGAWNEGMQSLLGIKPPRPSQGFLQDVHWSCGLFGYFPTYSLGNLIAAQMLEALHRDFGGREVFDAQIERGEFAPIREWLRQKVHAHGRALTPEQIVRSATGAPLSSEPFLHYVRGKYL
jgi:carboxypeptidase Taq